MGVGGVIYEVLLVHISGGGGVLIFTPAEESVRLGGGGNYVGARDGSERFGGSSDIGGDDGVVAIIGLTTV